MSPPIPRSTTDPRLGTSLRSLPVRRPGPSFLPVSPAQSRLQCRVAAEIVAAFLQMSPDDIVSKRRCRADVAHARHTAMYLAHVGFQLSQPVVALGFDRDRSSIVYAIQRIEDERDDGDFDRLLTRMESLAQCCRRLAISSDNEGGV